MAKKPKEVIKEKVVKEVLAAPQSVFFAFNSSAIASKKEILNLESLANMAKNNGAKLKVTGFADSATGSAAYNQQLSERRAKAVAKELVKLGVAEENIVVEGKGGVAEVKPASTTVVLSSRLSNRNFHNRIEGTCIASPLFLSAWFVVLPAEPCVNICHL